MRDFLRSRGIDLPEGSPDDDPDQDTVNGVGNRKNVLLLKKIHDDGVKVFEDARRYLERARDAGLRRFVVSSSANTRDVLHVTGLEQFIEGRVDGVTIREQNLKGKPAPDSFLAGAKLADVGPEQAVVFEDALAGVEAGRAGKFGFVVGVNRVDDEHATPCASTARPSSSTPWTNCMTDPGAFPIEPWELREVGLDLDDLARSESLFALSNGHIGIRGNLDEGDPRGCPAPTSTRSTRSGRCPTPRPATGSPRTARASSTSPTARCSGCSSTTSRSTCATAPCCTTSACSTCAPASCTGSPSGARRPASGSGCAPSGWCR